MADNYLEKRYEETLGTKRVTKKVGHTLDELLTRNRSTRGYNKNFIVKREMMEQIVGVNTKIGSGCNRQVLRFKIVTQGVEAKKILSCIKMGAALPELHLPFPGTEPEAFIVVCSTVKEDKLALIDLGMSLEAMSLKAAEMGLNSLIVGAFNKAKLMEILSINIEPLAVLCVGKGAEKFKLIPINEGESHAYYREQDGTHCIPKVKLSDLIML